MSAQRTCLYALRFVLLSHKDVLPTTGLAPEVRTLVSDVRGTVQRFKRGLQSPDELAIDERLATCSCLKSLEHVLEVWPERQDWDMREFEEGIGPFPQLAEIHAALGWVRGVAVTA